MKPVRFPSASLPASEHPCACMVCSTQHLLGFRGELCDSCATFLEVAPVLLLLSVRSRLCFSVCPCDQESSTFVDFHGPPRGSCAALHYFAPVLLRLGQRHAGRAGRPLLPRLPTGLLGCTHFQTSPSTHPQPLSSHQSHQVSPLCRGQGSLRQLGPAYCFSPAQLCCSPPTRGDTFAVLSRGSCV